MEDNDQDEIIGRVTELLLAMVAENNIETEDAAAIIFSSTPDLNAAFPAAAARVLGWSAVPLFGTQEIENSQGVAKCIRVLLLWNTEKSQKEIRHVYLHGAAILRQDIAPGRAE